MLVTALSQDVSSDKAVVVDPVLAKLVEQAVEGTGHLAQQAAEVEQAVVEELLLALALPLPSHPLPGVVYPLPMVLLRP